MEFANRLTIAAQVKVLLLETVHQDLEFVVFTRKFMFSYPKVHFYKKITKNENICMIL